MGIDLTEAEVGILLGLVRAAIRKAARGDASLRERYGADFDPRRIRARQDLLEGLYRKLGKDPENMRQPGHAGGPGKESATLAGPTSAAWRGPGASGPAVWSGPH